jgi:MoxR-like ATPase
MDLSAIRDAGQELRRQVDRVVVGQGRVIDLLLVALLSEGHVLLEGVPGTAKTLLAQTFSACLSLKFGRIQFTPDLMPGDVLGTNLFDFRTNQFTLTKGPIFTELLLADEINRTPPRTQAALLEAMQERQVTVEGKAHRLPDPFLVIATQNPYEHRDVFDLPESQLDRFLFKIVLDYSDAQSEYEMLNLPHKGVAPDMLGEVRPLLGVVGLDRARDELDRTELPEDVGRYMVSIARKTRDLPGVELGVSSRGVIHLASAAKANARLSGRDEVTVADVREIAPYVLRHRLILDDSLSPDDVLRDVIEQVAAPERTYSLR